MAKTKKKELTVKNDAGEFPLRVLTVRLPEPMACVLEDICRDMNRHPKKPIRVPNFGAEQASMAGLMRMMVMRYKHEGISVADLVRQEVQLNAEQLGGP